VWKKTKLKVIKKRRKKGGMEGGQIQPTCKELAAIKRGRKRRRSQPAESGFEATKAGKMAGEKRVATQRTTTTA